MRRCQKRKQSQKVSGDCLKLFCCKLYCSAGDSEYLPPEEAAAQQQQRRQSTSLTSPLKTEATGEFDQKLVSFPIRAHSKGQNHTSKFFSITEFYHGTLTMDSTVCIRYKTE